jgi:hypothetical protein
MGLPTGIKAKDQTVREVVLFIDHSSDGKLEKGEEGTIRDKRRREWEKAVLE